MNDILYTTRYIRPESTILIVDPDYTYVDEALQTEPDIRASINQHIEALQEVLILLSAQGHEIAMTYANKPFGLTRLANITLPSWEQHDKDCTLGIHPDIIEFAKGRDIVVGGLWKQLCVFEVARLLQQHYGDKVRLFDGDLLTISYPYDDPYDVDDVLTLRQSAEEYGMKPQMIK